MEPASDQATPSVFIPDDEQAPVSGLKRLFVVLLMVVTVGLAAYLLTGRPPEQDSTNLVGLVASEPIEAKPLLETSKTEDIESMLREKLGYRLLVPTVVGAEVVGVGTWDADRGVQIPVISYHDPEGDISQALVMNYAMLDRISGAVFLDRSIRKDLEDKSFTVVSASNNREIVVWRSGDDILLAIAKKGARRLIERIVQPGSGSEG